MTQHSSGEWRFNQKYEPSALVEILNDEGEAIDACIECHSADTRAEDEANARLVSAAPALYKACKFFMASLDSGQLVRDITKDALADWAPKMMELVSELAKASAAIAKVEGGE